MVQNHYIIFKVETSKPLFKVKTSNLHQFTELKASVVGISFGIGYPMVGTVLVVKINWYTVSRFIHIYSYQ